MAYTKGPWSVQECLLRGGRYFSVYRNANDASGLEFEALDIHESENGEDDARLIAAAPDLLEALKEQVGACWADDCEMCHRHRLVIAKAEGRPND